MIAPFSVAVGPNGDIYVLDSADPPNGEQSLIDVFRSNANGNVAPKQVIGGPLTRLNQAFGLAVTGDGIYTDTWNGKYIERFSLKANGDEAPKAVISGSNTQLGCCLDGMAVGADDSIYVVDRDGDHSGPSIQQFAALAKGNVAPLTMIGGSNTGFVVPVHMFIGPQPY